MQRSQRALDNPGLDVAVEAANTLENPAVADFAPWRRPCAIYLSS
jgi:hypothetical protein